MFAKRDGSHPLRRHRSGSQRRIQLLKVGFHGTWQKDHQFLRPLHAHGETMGNTARDVDPIRDRISMSCRR